MRQLVVNLALKLVGCPYIWGGQNPWTGLDCSGFVIWIYQVFGILPSGDWTAQGLLDHFAAKMEETSKTPLAGDLAFYGPHAGAVTHVMLYVATNLVVGESGGGHLTTTVEEARRTGAQVKVKPAGYRSDLKQWLHVKFPGE